MSEEISYGIVCNEVLTNPFSCIEDATDAAEELCKQTEMKVKIVEVRVVKHVLYKGCNPLKWITKRSTSKRR